MLDMRDLRPKGEAAIAGGADLAHLARQFSSMVTPFSSVMKS
jgi:hypothetical protein